MTPYRAAPMLFVLLLLPGLVAAAPEGKVVIAQGVDPTTLDQQWHEESPAYNVLLNVYDTLLFRDKTWGNTTWDADGTLGALFRTSNPQTNYHNPDFDGMIDEAQTSVDPKRRQELYARAQRMVVDDGAVLPLYQQMDLYGVNKRVNFQALSSEQLVGVWMSLKGGK